MNEIKFRIKIKKSKLIFTFDKKKLHNEFKQQKLLYNCENY